MSETIYPVAVIGGGSAGTMAVLRTVLNNDETLFLPGTGKDKKKSRAMWVAKVENMPGHQHYKKGIEEPNRASLSWLKDESAFGDIFHWKKNRGATEITKRDDGLFVIKDNKDEEYISKHIILCTGIMDVQPIINGGIESVFPYANNQTIDYCLRCDGHHTLNMKTGIIGHSNVAGWVACMIKERYDNPEMMIFTHGKKPEFSDEVLEMIKAYDIKVHEEEIIDVKGQEKGKILDSLTLKDKGDIEVGFCFVSLGMIVYNELAKSIGAKVDDRGFVLTNEKGETDIENFYVAGDIRAGFKKQIYSAWDMAVDSGDDINAKIRREKRKKILANS